MIADRSTVQHEVLPDDERTPLDNLNETLAHLEQRLTKLTSVDGDGHRRKGSVLRPSEGETETGTASSQLKKFTARPALSLSDTVSQIAMRQKILAQATATTSAARRDAQMESAGRRNEVAAQLERLRAELRRDMSQSMNQRVDAVRETFEDLRRMIADKASTGDVIAEIDRVESNLTRMESAGGDQRKIRALKDELEAMRKLVERSGLSDDSASKENDPEASTLSSGEASMAEIIPSEEARGEILPAFADTDRAAADSIGATSTVVAQADMEDRFEALAARMGEIELALGNLPQTLAIGSLEDRVHSLADGIERLSRQKDDAEAEQFAQLDERLDEISRSIVSAAGRRAQISPEVVQRIEDRLRTLNERVEELTSEAAPDDLSRRVAELSERIDTMSHDPRSRELEERMDRFAASLESFSEQNSLAGPERDDVERRLGEVEGRISDIASAPGMEAIQSLEGRVEKLASLIGEGAGMPAGGQALDERLSDIERRLEENGEAILTMARTAADEAVSRMLESGDVRHGEHVGALSADLRKLEVFCRENGARTHEFYTAVHTTLQQLVRRIGQIEVDLKGERPAAHEESADVSAPPVTADEATVWTTVPAEQVSAETESLSGEADSARSPGLFRRAFRSSKKKSAKGSGAADAAKRAALGGKSAVSPSDGESVETIEQNDASSLDAAEILESREANQPLKIGSGAPDIDALIARVRSEQKASSLRTHEDDDENDAGKSDFIAAARRAASAAAADVDVLRTGSEKETDASTDAGTGSRVRKPILMAMGAILLTLMAIPVGQSLLSSRTDEASDSAKTTSHAPTQASSQVDSTSAPAQPVPSITGSASDEAAADSSSEDEVSTLETSVTPSVPVAPNGQPALAETQPAALPTKAPATIATGDGFLATPTEMQPPRVASMETPKAPLEETSADPVQTTSEAPESAAVPAAASEKAAPVTGSIGAAAVDNGATSDAPIATPAGIASSQKPGAASDPLVSKTLASAHKDGTEADTRALLKVSALPTVPEKLEPQPLKEAATSGDPRALFEVGLRTMEGVLGTPDPKAAAEWFRASATRGYAPAQYSMGTLYEKGNGVDRSLSAARDWYLKAAEQGNVRAMHNLAVLFATGIDGKSDPALATGWFERAADYGMTDSQYNLGILYARGAGVDQDLVQSYKWFDLVAQKGDTDAAQKRDEIAKTLTPDQLQAAKKLVADFVPLQRSDSANTVDVPKSWASLKTDPIETSSIDMKKAIRNVQALLIKFGYHPGTPDGIVGEQTAEAIRAFQKKVGLDVTGKIDTPLLRALLERKDS